MPLSILLIMSVGLVVGAALQCLAPLNFRPGIFFGVTVDAEFRQTEDRGGSFGATGGPSS